MDEAIKNSTSCNAPKSDIRTKVYEEFLKNISTGTWKPGDKIPSENQLARSMGVSRITVREAMQKLVALNLVETQQGKSSHVKEFSASNGLFMLYPEIFEPSKEDIYKLLEFRRILEVGMMPLVVERAKPEDIEVLLGYTHSMSGYLDDFESYAFYDAQFHAKLTQMSNNPVIINATGTIGTILRKSILRTLSPAGAVSGVMYNTHIVNAIRTKDKAAATKVMNDLLDDVEASLSLAAATKED